MAANYESLKGVVADCKSTLTGAAKTIRSLIQQRNDALAAAKPADVVAAKKERESLGEAAGMQADLEQARADAQAAIGEVEATPVITPKPAAPAPEYPKVLADSTPQKRPNVTVDNLVQENIQRGLGFTVVVP